MILFYFHSSSVSIKVPRFSMVLTGCVFSRPKMGPGVDIIVVWKLQGARCFLVVV